MSAEHQDQSPTTHLLSDEEFTQLMEAEYIANGTPVDETVKQRVWRNINKFRPQTAQNRRHWIPLAVAATLILTLAPLLMLDQSDTDYQRTKGPDLSNVFIFLEAYTLNAGGELHRYQQPVRPGETLVFKTKASRPSYVALAMARPDTPPAVRFSAQNRRPGILHVLEKDGQSYGYQTEASDRQLRFCVVAGQTTEDLQALTTALVEIWPQIPNRACIDVVVTAD